jgi:16S rRNA (uracil1498-N3)-methyltransferase
VSPSSPPWFVADPGALAGDLIALGIEETHHALSVLRVSVGDPIVITDGEGGVAKCEVREIDGRQIIAKVAARELRSKPAPEIVVYQGAAKGAKNDAVIERLAEVGVAETSVYSSERSVVRWDEDKRDRLPIRWEAIARSVVKQSRNPYQMRTPALLAWDSLIERISEETVVCVLWEEASDPLRSFLPQTADRVAVVVGPEGGLTSVEANALAGAGGHLVSLGPRILRTENAGFVAAAAISYHYELIG